MAPVRYLAGGHRPRIHKPRLLRTYRANSLSSLSFSLWHGSGGVRCLARCASKDRAHCWLLHAECPSVSLVACHVSPAQHPMVPAMDYRCVIKHHACGDARGMASEFSDVPDGGVS